MEKGVMIAASSPRAVTLDERLLVVDPHAGTFRDSHIRDFPSFFSKGDLLVVNDAATLPASLRAADGRFELRLLGRKQRSAVADSWEATPRFDSILFGEGDFRTPTERRPAPPKFAVGDALELSGGLRATLTRVDDEEPRLVEIEFDRTGADFYKALYAAGRPIQYAHVPGPLALFSVQNRYAARPWAFESSAGRPLTWATLIELKRRGIDIAQITHAAGISSTGSETLDKRLPLREHYAVDAAAVNAVVRAKSNGGRVVAVGTTVVRALESAAREGGGVLAPVEGDTGLVIGPGFRPAIVDGILSGMHARGTSHYSLLRAFASESLLDEALSHAEAQGYLEHEFGDSCLILASHD
jgi:S-adenosylmethionine:tRNA ribosyltransferase-isomerase